MIHLLGARKPLTATNQDIIGYDDETDELCFQLHADLPYEEVRKGSRMPLQDALRLNHECAAWFGAAWALTAFASEKIVRCPAKTKVEVVEEKKAENLDSGNCESFNKLSFLIRSLLSSSGGMEKLQFEALYKFAMSFPEGKLAEEIFDEVESGGPEDQANGYPSPNFYLTEHSRFHMSEEEIRAYNGNLR